MAIEMDDEAQAGIDEAEAEAAEAADLSEEEAEQQFSEGAARSEDAADEETGEMEFLQELERLDRKMMGEEANKDANNKVSNKRIKDIRKKRNAVLDDLEAYRLGQRGLPLE